MLLEWEKKKNIEKEKKNGREKDKNRKWLQETENITEKQKNT